MELIFAFYFYIQSLSLNLTISESFFCRSLGFLRQRTLTIMMTALLSNYCVYFPCLTVLAEDPSSAWSRSGKLGFLLSSLTLKGRPLPCPRFRGVVARGLCRFPSR